MKKSYIIITILTAVSFFTSCTSSSESNGKNITILFDISNSIKSSVQDEYLQTIENNICNGLTQYDKIRVLPVDAASETASKALLDLDLYEYKDQWDVMGLNANETDKLKKEAFAKFIRSKMVELRNNVAIAKEKRSEAGAGRSTDILGALTVAQEQFSNGFDNSIIIMSDMEQYADKCKMNEGEKAENWLKQTASISFDKIKNFSINIYTGQQLGMHKPYYVEISSFWHQFFNKQGVSSITYLSSDAGALKHALLAYKKK